jgi:hypothetical protein
VKITGNQPSDGSAASQDPSSGDAIYDAFPREYP